jgi:REP element-mobilizing transposase RayT
VYATIQRKCGESEVEVVAIGGIEDHVHLLVNLPSTICVADFVQSIKGVSSMSTNKAFGMTISAFRWQLGYGVHTVSPSHLSKVRKYIANQEEHHRTGQLWNHCEPKGKPANQPL